MGQRGQPHHHKVLTVPTHFIEVGQRSNAGQEIRLADIEADAGAGMGVFETIHNQLSPASMALSLKKYSSRYHGAVGMAWLQQVVANRQMIGRSIADIIHRFVETVIQSNANGQTIRVARRYGFVLNLVRLV